MAKLIDTNDLKEGMKLAVSVKNKYGQVLIAEGIKLEERHKLILLTWGIQNFYIREDSSEEKVQYDDAAISNAKELIKKRISWLPRNYCEEEIYNLTFNEILAAKNNQLKI